MPKKINKRYYNKTNTCDKIKEDGKKCGNELKPHSAYKEIDENGNWTGKWWCKDCYGRYDYNKRSDCSNNLIKSVSVRRTGNINPGCNSAKGDLFEELTCKWRGVKRLSVERDNYALPLDHSRDPELGIIQTKGALYNSDNRSWSFNCKNEQNKNFDNLIVYCASEDGSIIDRIYIFPRHEIVKRISITIYNKPESVRGPFWCEQYRLKDENIMKTINKIFWSILSE